MALYDAGLVPLTRAAIAVVEERSATLITRRENLNNTTFAANNIEDAVTSVNTARALLAQTDAYQARLGQAQNEFQDFLILLNNAIETESRKLRPTARDLAQALVDIVQGIEQEVRIDLRSQ